MAGTSRLALLGVLFLTGVAGPRAETGGSESLLASDSVRVYDRAVRDMNTGNGPRAAAMLKGLLLDRVRVGVDTDDLSVAEKKVFSDGVLGAVQNWGRALRDSPFLFVGSDGAADVLIRPVAQIDRKALVQGLVRANRRFFYEPGGRTGYVLDGEIFVRDNVDARALTADEVTRVASHELGHLLGLDDRYTGKGLMSAFTPGPGRQDPTSEELAAVQQFRSRARSALVRVAAAQAAERRTASKRP